MADDDDSLESTRMSLGDHLEELRKRLVKSAVVLAVAFGIAWWQSEPIAAQVLWPWTRAVTLINADLVAEAEAHLLAHPERPRSELFMSDDPANQQLRNAIDPRPNMFGIGDAFFFQLNNAIYFALFFGSPYVLWQMWQFVAAGLYRHEKRAVSLYFPFSALLFLVGVLFCYFLVVPIGMYALGTSLSIELVKPMIGIDQYFSFLSTMCLAMGLVFQIPIVMVFLARFGLVEPATYARMRGHFLVGALLLAAIVTPGPDYYSQILMTVPMVVLYEIGIFIAKRSARSRRHPPRAARRSS
ncbi:MAG: twin-arginine translocase subunit TatC [Planctomycetota bacterium]